MNKLKSLISYTLYPVLFFCLVSCGNTATKPKPNNFEKVEERGLFSFTDEQTKAD